MLHAIHSNTYYVRAKIFIKGACAALKPKRSHPSGYQAGNSPGTDSLPIIDEQLKVLGLANRSVAHASGLRHPSVHLFVFSPDKRYVLIQARASNKDFSGNKLASPVSGHISGNATMLGQILGSEAIEKTLDKEAYEEAGLQNLIFQFVAKFAYQSHWNANYPGIGGKYSNQEIAFLYSTQYRGPVIPNLSEVKWLGWFSLDGIMKLTQKKPSLFAPSFLKDLEILKNNEII